MKALILYYTETGQTRKAAGRIARGLEKNGIQIKLEKVRTVKRKTRWWNLILPLLDYIDRVEIDSSDLDDYELIVIGSPTWNFSPSTPVYSFVSKYNGWKNKKVAVFAVCRKWGGMRVVKKLSKKIIRHGGQIIGTLVLKHKHPDILTVFYTQVTLSKKRKPRFIKLKPYGIGKGELEEAEIFGENLLRELPDFFQAP